VNGLGQLGGGAWKEREKGRVGERERGRVGEWETTATNFEL
jgi:hypothetical protein